MSRPGIKDLAQAAGVSVATVNRVISGSAGVKQATKEAVLQAAREIGFYGAGALQQRVAGRKKTLVVGLLVQSPHNLFAASLIQAFAAEAGRHETGIVLQVEHVTELSPEAVADKLLALSTATDGVAVLAAEHPVVTGMIDTLSQSGFPVVAIVSPLSSRASIGYVGLDSWKVGRTAAWAIKNLCKAPGKVGILIGTHRYRCHDLYESGFRSYFRELAGEFRVLESVSTFESDSIARELTENLLQSHIDLKGIYVSGGGVAGVAAALRDSGRHQKMVTVCHDLMDSTRKGLIDNLLTLVISHPFDKIAQETLGYLLQLTSAESGGAQSIKVPFSIYTSENI